MLVDLISLGKHVNLVDNNKRTPLHLAASNNHYQAVKILVENNANPFAKTNKDEIAINLSNDLKIKKLIEECEKNMSYIKSENFFKEKVIKDYAVQIKDMFTNNIKNIQEEDNKITLLNKDEKAINDKNKFLVSNNKAIYDLDSRKYQFY